MTTRGGAIHASVALLPEGWSKDVRVEIGSDGRIVSVAPGVAFVTDAVRVPFLLPALSNLHSHTFQRAMAGLTETRGPSEHDSFWTWREVMYRFLDVLTPDEIEAIAAYAFMEMQEAGFAAVAEFHYLHNRPGGARYDDPAELSLRIAAAAAETGIGLTLLPVHYAQGGVDGRPLAGGQLRFRNDLASFEALVARMPEIAGRLSADAGWGVAPHSLRAVSRDDLRHLAALAPGHPLHMHIAEQEKELEETRTVFGARPVQWLLSEHDVSARWCLIHCTHMTPGETEGLARSGAVAGLCPVTEANLGDGIFDGRRFLSFGGSIGVGSDSNIRISASEELRQLEYSQRLRDRRRVVLADPGQSAGDVLYRAALAGGARALGRDTGAIEKGRWADLVALDLDAAGYAPLGEQAALDSWVFSAGNAAVSDLWSAGRHKVRSGRHVAREAIAARYRACLASILERF
ncbi:formimidoylglutamate deiminase [Mesorhizobium australicum]|uniref:Formimidoylglutamate deiminase n=1 Tax=Mesorhizobium australicum TaxID=536018 RepID=A0A1X7N702_9HYPH|nr:formimidoylglutamate deiminase [Mesorhizobium australicum]SMH33279.1 formimidoylglutamate deiminase [Mesorhizobium australicum]